MNKNIILIILFLSMGTFASTREEFINEYANNLDIDPLLVKSIIYHESRGNVNALSNKGARGLMQVMPATARFVGINPSFLFDEKENIRAGIRYLSFLKKTFKGDIIKMVASYNAGHGSVIKYNGIPPYKETINYTKNVLNSYMKLKNITKDNTLEGYNINKFFRNVALSERKPYISKQNNVVDGFVQVLNSKTGNYEYIE